MNRLLYYLFFSLLLFSSCGNKYCIVGETQDRLLDGTTIYIKKVVDSKWEIVDSCEILHGAFSMSGGIDTTCLATLFIDDEAILPIVLESGRINIVFDRMKMNIFGTSLNDELNAFVDNKEKLENRMFELERMETKLILEGLSPDAATDYVMDTINCIGKKMDALLETFIVKNYNTVLGPCVFRLLCSTLPYPLMTSQIESILKDAPYYFRKDEFVREFIETAEENSRRLQTRELD